MFETSLRIEEQRRLTEIGGADLLVGIPTFRNAQTIGRAVEATADGMRTHFPSLRSAIAVVDSGSSDETMEIAASRPLPPSVQRIVTTYQGALGKGSAVRAIFEMARRLRVKACIVLEADSTSISPNWIQRLGAPILSGEYDLVVPWYTRPLVEGGVSDILAYPLTRSLYGVDVRQPMAGDLGLSGELAARLYERDVWETDVARQGIDIWITTVAINGRTRMCQARLGVKTREPRELATSGDPAHPAKFAGQVVVGSSDPNFVQAVGTLFRMMEIYRRRWSNGSATRVVPLFGDSSTSKSSRLASRKSSNWLHARDDLRAVTVDVLSDAFLNGARRHRRLWRSILVPSNFREIYDLANRPRGASHFSPELWARVVFDFAVVYNKGENDPDQVVASLLPLYYARVGTALRETGAKLNAVEKAVQAQAKSFADQKKYLLHRWETYVPWAMDGVR